MKRRALLSTLGGSYLTLTAGCLSQNGTSGTPSNPQSTTTKSTSPPTGTGSETKTPEPTRANLIVENDDDEEHTLSIRVRNAAGDEGTAILDRSVDVSDGPGFGMGVAGSRVGEGTYRVTAELDTGATLDYEWRVTAVARDLSIVITSDGSLEPRQRLAEGGDGNLPYDVSGAKDIFAPPRAEIRNESDEDTMLTIGIEHDGDRFFEHTFNAETDREISTPPLVKSHATYDVSVETDDGRSASYEWTIPENWGWPLLAILVAEDGSLMVGCSWPRRRSISVENTDETDHELTLMVSGDGSTVAETTQTVSPGESEYAFDVPIGDEYELTVETDGGSETVTYAACYCWNTRVTVTLAGGTPAVETFHYWCE
ncbi:hypothetical protein C440_11418 [Haloferax mucosum ATCC BAA-1512]|uniref:Ig-like domain-containing protein n=1 Tax=Haloferax mucosum ATCC BAA-1512 TaxID=662479 RepID=M0IDS4_9EURY|nr:hypothetical protein [Haloferax mucosum]ELZ94227.1 hypothetical protein C440_11418 [Haloferax mucosum ATCC BAA-1512]